MTSRAAVTERQVRISTREREPAWRKPARRIHSAECIGCDSCMRACPAQFDAVFNHGLDVVIIPELCNGCGLCVQACPVDCIYPDPEPETTSAAMWRFVEAQELARGRA